MKPILKPKDLVTLVAVFLLTMAFAQTYDGDALTSYLGKNGESPEVKALITNYKCDVGNPEHCFSKEGLELILKKGIVTEIRLHQGSKVYGSFKGKLPQKLRFGMSTGDVRAVLGKPTVSYSTSGYSEFDLKHYSVACWFEGGLLSQVTIFSKGRAM